MHRCSPTEESHCDGLSGCAGAAVTGGHEMMGGQAGAATALLLLCVLRVGHGHLGTAPGRFFAPPPPIPVNLRSNASCATTFALNGSKYDVSSLQVDVGGWVAENSVDKFSCAQY